MTPERLNGGCELGSCLRDFHHDAEFALKEDSEGVHKHPGYSSGTVFETAPGYGWSIFTFPDFERDGAFPALLCTQGRTLDKLQQKRARLEREIAECVRGQSSLACGATQEGCGA